MAVAAQQQQQQIVPLLRWRCSAAVACTRGGQRRQRCSAEAPWRGDTQRARATTRVIPIPRGQEELGEAADDLWHGDVAVLVGVERPQQPRILQVGAMAGGGQ